MIANRIQSISVKTPPAALPVSLSDMKSYLHQAGSADDALITSLIEAARQQCQTYAAYAIGTQTRIWQFGHNAEREILLLYKPTDATGVKVEYRSCRVQPFTDITSESGGGINDKSWEIVDGYFIGPRPGLYRLEAICGESTINAAVIDALKLQCAYLYMNRGDANVLSNGLCGEAAAIMQTFKQTVF